MRNRLYIFNFNTLKFSRPTGAFWVATCLFSLVCICSYVFYDELVATSGDSITNRISLLKRNPDVKIIAFGSSRFRSCINAQDLAIPLGLTEDKILNLSGDSMGAWEALVEIRNSGHIFKNKPICLVELSPWHFNSISWHPILKKPETYKDVFQTWATWDERINFPDKSAKAELIRNGIFKLLVFRKPIIDWLKYIKKLVFPTYFVKIMPPIYHFDVEKEKKLRNDPDFMAENISIYHMKDYTFSEYKKNIFLELIHEITIHGGNVIIVQPPVRPAYFNYVNSNIDRKHEFEKHKKFILELKRKYQCLIWEVPSDMGLTEDIFVDYGHFSKKGATIFSEKLAKAIR